MSNRRGRVEKSVESSETLDHGKNDDNDISFMDTEPLDVTDVSVLNTEAMELSHSDVDDEAAGSRSETSETDVENEESEKDGGSSNNEDSNENESDHLDAGDNDDIENESVPDSQSEEECDFRDDISHMFDDSSSGSSQPPAIDITMAPSHEVKRIYSDLIDSCRGFDDDLSFQEGSNKRVLKDNIKTGQALFQQLEMTLSNTFSETDGDSTGRPVMGHSVSEFHLSCQHTKYCATMLSHAVNNAINVETVFKVDEFLNNLRNSCLDNIGGYSVLSAVRKLAFTASSVSYSVSHYKTVMGCIDTESFRIKSVKNEPESEALSTKIRPKRKKDEVKEEDATQTEIVNEKSTPSSVDEEIKNDTPDGLATGILKFVRNNFKDQGAPVNMLQVAHADNVPDVISHLFGVAFLVRDGHVSLNTLGDNEDAETSCTALTLKPEKPPRSEKDADRKQRNQHIASFSVRLLKHLVESNQDSDD